MKKYKLTTQKLTTYGGFKWEVGKKFTTSGEGDLCGPGFLHYYHHPLLAVLLNPIHADIYNPKLFEVEAEGIHKDDNGLKGGCTEMTIVKEIKLPQISTTQRVAFAILTSLDVYKDNRYKEWAENWLSGKDRSQAAAWSARAAAWSARAAAEAAAMAAMAAEWAAARAVWAAQAARPAAKAAEISKRLIECAEKCLEY